MSVLVVDVFGLVLIGIGVVLVLKGPSRPTGTPEAQGRGGDPGVYARRIGGTMLAAFGLALGLMVTLYHFASAG
ncbi:MAG: hypothetical protein ACXWI4_02135 [Croceibacterium sp.]